MKNCYLLKELAICQLSVAELLSVLSVGCAVSAGLREVWAKEEEDGEGNGPQPLRKKNNLAVGDVIGFLQELERSYVYYNTWVSVYFKI